jgi:hypothetical protein
MCDTMRGRVRAVTIENWREQLRRGGLELAILSAVAGAPRYGLDIVSISRSRPTCW